MDRAIKEMTTRQIDTTVLCADAGSDANVDNIAAHGFAKRMVDQVGGMNDTKKPMLRIEGQNLVLKPVRMDHRGCREIAFYECMEMVNLSNRGDDRKTNHNDRDLTSICHAYREFITKSEKSNIVDIITKKIIDPSVWDRISRLYSRFRKYRNINLTRRKHHAKTLPWTTLQQEVKELCELRQFIPKYYGVLDSFIASNNISQRLSSTISISGSSTSSSSSTSNNGKITGQSTHQYLCLEDLTATFVKPCVMDIKLGRQTFEPDAPHEKRVREMKKYPQQSEFGLRIVGMRVCDPYYHPENSSFPLGLGDDSGYYTFDKHFGRSLLTRHHLENAFRIFFSAGLAHSYPIQLVEPKSSKRSEHSNGIEFTQQLSSTLRKDPCVQSSSKEKCQRSIDTADESLRISAVKNVLSQLKTILLWFEGNSSLSFYASSLLIVYEGCLREADVKQISKENEYEHSHEMVEIKMIDLARVRRGSAGDPGYIHGLTTLISVLEGLMEERELRQKA